MISKMHPMQVRENPAIRILLLTSGSSVAAQYAQELEQSGFEVVYGADAASAISACQRSTMNPVRAALIVDDSTSGDTARIATTLCDASPGLPCVLLPAGTPARECEVAIRTAIRWNYNNR